MKHTLNLKTFLLKIGQRSKLQSIKCYLN